MKRIALGLLSIVLLAIGVPLILIAVLTAGIAMVTYFFGYGLWTAAIAVLKIGEHYGTQNES